MAKRFTAFRKIRNHETTVKTVQLDSFEFDQSLFPVKIPTEIQDEFIDRLAVPSILRNKFYQQGISHLGQLSGLEASTFLSWPGFGSKCLSVLCGFLRSLQSGQVQRLPYSTDGQNLPDIEFEQITKPNLSSDVLMFPLTKLNIPTLIKTRLKEQYGIETIENFLDKYENGALSRPGIGTRTIQFVFKEILALSRLGSNSYLEEITLDNQSFLRLVSLAKGKMTGREQLIFDHRFVPFTVEFLTLEAIARQLGLTRERVRQIEKDLVKKFQSGTLREFGWAIRRNALRIFKAPTDEFTFNQFISHNFFQGCTLSSAKIPFPIRFLDKVFYSTFKITDNTIKLNQNVARRNFT